MNKTLIIGLIIIFSTSNIYLVNSQNIVSPDDFGASYAVKPGDYANYTISKLYNPTNFFRGAIFLTNGSVISYNYSLGLKISNQVIDINKTRDGKNQAFVKETVSKSGEKNLSEITNRSSLLSETFDNPTAINDYYTKYTAQMTKEYANITYTPSFDGGNYILHINQHVSNIVYSGNVTYNLHTGWMFTKHAMLSFSNGTIIGEITIDNIYHHTSTSSILDIGTFLTNNFLLVAIGEVLVVTVVSILYIKAKNKAPGEKSTNTSSNTKDLHVFKRTKKQKLVIHPETSLKMIEEIIKENEE